MPILRAESQRKIPKRYQTEHRVKETRVHEANTIRTQKKYKRKPKRKASKSHQAQRRVEEATSDDYFVEDDVAEEPRGQEVAISVAKEAVIEGDDAVEDDVLEEDAGEDQPPVDAAEEVFVQEHADMEDATYDPMSESDSDSEHSSSDSSSAASDSSSAASDSSSADEEQQVRVLPKKRKCRGKHKLRENMIFSKRPELFVIGDRAFRSEPHCRKIPNTISQLVLRNVKGPYVTYREFPKGAKKECLRAFLLKYRWGNKEDVTHCSKVFHRIAGVRYSNILSKLRSDLTIKKAKSNDPNKWKQFPPNWCSPEDWDSMCDQFNSPTFRKKAIRNGQNRLKNGIKVYHRHGSSNTYNLSRNMEERLKRPVNFAEVFVETHLKKGSRDEFYDPKAAAIPENYKKLMNEEYGRDKKKWPRFDNAIWVQASGGRKRGRIYGVPSVIDSSKLPGGHKSKFPVLDNIHSSTHRNSGVEQHLSDDDYDDDDAHYAHKLRYDDDDDDEDDDEEGDDFDYVPRYEREKARKLRKINDFDESEYDESEFDFEAPKSDESDAEEDSDDGEDEYSYWY